MTNRYKKVSDWIYFFGVLPALAALPRNWGYSLIRKQGRHLHDVQNFHREEIARNLNLVLNNGRVATITRRTFEILASEDLDAFYFPFWNKQNIDRYFSFEGLEYLDQARKSGRGVLLYTGHIGCVCSALVALGLKGYPVNHLSRDSRVEDTFHPAFRAYARFKIGWVEKKAGRNFVFINRGNYPRLIQMLGEDELVSIAIDVPPELAKRTETVEFLGRRCLFPTGLVSLAYESGAPVIPYFVLRKEEQWPQQRLIVREPIALTGNLQMDLQCCVHRLNQVILDHPSQWFGWDSLSLFWKKDHLP